MMGWMSVRIGERMMGKNEKGVLHKAWKGREWGVKMRGKNDKKRKWKVGMKIVFIMTTGIGGYDFVLAMRVILFFHNHFVKILQENNTPQHH